MVRGRGRGYIRQRAASGELVECAHVLMPTPQQQALSTFFFHFFFLFLLVVIFF